MKGDREITLQNGSSISVSTREEHYEIRDYLKSMGLSFQDEDEWRYDEFPDIGFDGSWMDGIVGYVHNGAPKYITKEEFYRGLGLIPMSSHEGSVLKFNFLK